MCGIIGYKGKTKAVSVAVEGLKSLEYRGYDSWGIAHKSNSLEVHKQVGKVGSADFNVNSDIAIGHTRWATDGAVTEANAHPHLSSDKKIANCDV